MNYYISDLHFGSERILETAKRPFSSASAMNEAILANINKTVGTHDRLYILGDFCSMHVNPVPFLKQIKCKHLYLIKGNHDRVHLKSKQFRNCFEEIASYMRIKDDSLDIILSHYPMAEWDGYWQGTYHFYGHVHNGVTGPAFFMKMLPTAVNVGVDTNEFTPKTAKELIATHQKNFALPSISMAEFCETAIFVTPDNRNGSRVLDNTIFKNRLQ